MTFLMKKINAVAVAFSTQGPTVILIPVLPKPMTKSFTVTDSPTESDSIVPVLDLPMKISFPSRIMDQFRFERPIVPLFVIVAETPKPPFTVISINRSVIVRCRIAQSLFAS